MTIKQVGLDSDYLNPTRIQHNTTRFPSLINVHFETLMFLLKVFLYTDFIKQNNQDTNCTKYNTKKYITTKQV